MINIALITSYTAIIFALPFINNDFWYANLDQLSQVILLSMVVFINDIRCLKSFFITLLIYYGYVLLTDWYIEKFTIWQSAIECICFIWLLSYQLYKNYDIPSDNISTTEVCLIAYKPKRFKQYIVSLFGKNLSCIGCIIGDKVYHISSHSPTMKEYNLTDKDWSNYIIINTHYPADNVKHIIPELMKQKARQPNTLFLKINCLLSLQPLLDILPDKWHYKGEVLPSIYLSKRIWHESKRG